MEKQIYKSINAIQSDLAKVGISKDRRNQQQGYAFRGIDDVYAALAPLLAKHNVCILPRTTEHKVIERQTQRGGVLFYTTVRVEFDFVSSIDSSVHTCIIYGEAMDSADKSTNKAMSAAYKYACLQTFCIPTEGDNDADATTHEPVVAKKSSLPPATPGPMPSMPPAVDWLDDKTFETLLNQCNDLDSIRDLLNSQRGHPSLDTLVQMATARKQAIIDGLQFQGVENESV